MSTAELFGAEVGRAFAFLIEAHGYTAVCDGTVAFLSSPVLTWRIEYDPRSKALSTMALVVVDGRDVGAELACLYEHAGRGPAVRVPHLAVTAQALAVGLLAHAAAVRELLPLLDGPTRDRLLLACHGR